MTDVLGAIRHLGKCLREGKEIYMGVPAENVCIAAGDEIEKMNAAIIRIKSLVIGDARPKWDTSPETTVSRARIADICDDVLNP